jgi:hypothetical protein
MVIITNISPPISFAVAKNNSTSAIEIDWHNQEKHKLRTLDHLSGGKDHLVKGGDKVILDAGKNFEKDKADKLTFLWTQLEPKKPLIKIHDRDTAKAKFTAPDVDHTTVFKIKLSANNGKAEISDIVRIKVLDIVVHDEYDDGRNNKNETTIEDNPAQYNKNDKGHKSIDTSIDVPNDKVVVNSKKEQKNSGSNNSDNDNKKDKHGVDTQDLREDNSTNGSSNSKESQDNDNSTSSKSSLSLKCEPPDVKVIEGVKSSITCIVKNKTQKTLDIALECSGLEGTGVDCYVNGEHDRTRNLIIKEMSSESFPIVMSITSPAKIPIGSFPFTISANCKGNDVC